jgi:CelD/BcsL family acetyltransferase involved in cellulose biosynthesis
VFLTSQVDHKIEVHRREPEFAALREEWTALHSRSLNPVPYTAYDWIDLCWKRHRNDPRSELFVVTVRAENRLVLALPLRARRRALGFRVLSWIDSKTPFYSDVLLEDSAAGLAAAQVAAKYLATNRSIVRVRLNTVPQEAAVHHLLRWLSAKTRSSSQSGFIDLTQFAGAEDYLRRQSASLRYEFRYTQRALERLGEARIRVASSASQIDEGLNWLFTTKAKQLAAKGTLGAWFAAPETLKFFQSACKVGLSDGTSALYTLSMSGNILAAELVFTGGETYFLSKTATDRSLPRLSVGAYLRMVVVMDAIRAGVKTVDLMLGDYPWKERMRTGTKAVSSYRVQGFYLSRLQRVR